MIGIRNVVADTDIVSFSCACVKSSKDIFAGMGRDGEALKKT